MLLGLTARSWKIGSQISHFIHLSNHITYRTAVVVLGLSRNSALALLSRMATLFPAQMASRLRSLLDAVCAAAAVGEGSASGGGGGGARATLRQTQKAVQSVVPALKAHGSEAGVGAHFVVQVIRSCLTDVTGLATVV